MSTRPPGGLLASFARCNDGRCALGAYGTTTDGGLTERLITGGVDMFLSHYGPRNPQKR
ncbi:hypothetical protein [Streptomyces sp. Wb2n-11]|uniref:hypothetical protein n=1 Tax=Streptomyces sp. Wb2n-11 TaxID=1030533 RepID=UPI00159EC63C|nr:hypothetical protein [Streptomyces sp. Wb2n-11]